jgi:integrase
MSKPYNVHSCKYGASKWVVEAVAPEGRKRKFFRTKLDAQAYADLQNLEHRQWGEMKIPDEVRLQALQAHGILKPTGATLIQAAEYYVERHWVVSRSIYVTDLSCEVSEWAKDRMDKGEMSKSHCMNIQKACREIMSSFKNEISCEVRSSDIVKWLESMDVSASTKDWFRRYAGVVFAYAKSHGYCETNPCTGIPKMGKKKPIQILTPDQAQSLLKNCHPSMVPFYALGMFAGLRPMSELMRAEWKDIDWSDKTIKVENVKTAGHSNSARERHIPISENLQKWLELSGSQGVMMVGGKFIPGGWNHHVYGPDGDRKKAGITQWAPDIMRHSFASYHVAMHEDAALTAAAMGHSDTKLIYSTYRKLVKKSEAEKFWSIFP